MVYLHGGGYVKGGIDESDAFCRNLARVTRHIVVSVDYRRPPETRFPGAFEEIEIVTKGRHDPCVGIRAVPVGEAMVACVLADAFLRHRGQVGA